MAWFKVDDSFEGHPKVKAIPRARRRGAVGLWLLAGTWCARQLTDGHLARHMVDELTGSKSDVAQLVEVGLWHGKGHDCGRCPEPETDFVFHDWSDWQPTRSKVEADREAARERMAKARERGRNNPDTSMEVQDSSEDVRANTDRTSDAVRSTPSRPDPTIVRTSGSNASPTTDPEPVRGDVDRICAHLADHIEANTGTRPSIGAKWRDAARLLIDRDQRTEAQVIAAIDWCQSDEFWRGNILSLPKLREKYDQLRLHAQRSKATTPQQQTDDLFDRAAQRMGIA